MPGGVFSEYFHEIQNHVLVMSVHSEFPCRNVLNFKYAAHTFWTRSVSYLEKFGRSFTKWHNCVTAWCKLLPEFDLKDMKSRNSLDSAAMYTFILQTGIILLFLKVSTDQVFTIVANSARSSSKSMQTEKKWGNSWCKSSSH